MTNWDDLPHREATAIAFVKFVHLMSGLYIWEFVTNLDYEYSIFMKKRQSAPSFLVYVGCRWSTLFAVIVQFLHLDWTYNIVACRVLIPMSFITLSLSILSSSCLVALRVYALWEQNKLVMAVSSAFWLGSVASFIYVILTSHGHMIEGYCLIQNILRARICLFSAFITDLVLLVLMFSGFLRSSWKGCRERGGMWWTLYTQGLAWIAVVTVAEVPPVVLISLNLNPGMDSICMFSGGITLAVGASRMYRGLCNSTAWNGSSFEEEDTGKEVVLTTFTPSRFPDPLDPSRFERDADNVEGEGHSFPYGSTAKPLGGNIA